jgi:S1-C subfamily serine protease
MLLTWFPGAEFWLARLSRGSPAAEIGVERGLVIYRVGRHDVNSVKSIEGLLGRVQSGMTVDFTVGVVRNDGTREIQTVPLTAR